MHRRPCTAIVLEYIYIIISNTVIVIFLRSFWNLNHEYECLVGTNKSSNQGSNGSISVKIGMEA
jgi:hypothetical protein